MIDLKPDHLKEVQRILGEHFPGVEARVIGSRARGTAREHSDLDLALVGKERLEWRRTEALKDAFAQSDLPFTVDVLDWNAISDSFRRAILEQGYEVMPSPTDAADG